MSIQNQVAKCLSVLCFLIISPWILFISILGRLSSLCVPSMRDDSFNRLISQSCSVYCLDFIPQRLIATYFLPYMISHARFQCHPRQQHFNVTRHSFFRERLDSRYIPRWYNERNDDYARSNSKAYFVANAVNKKYKNMLTTLLFLQSLEIIYRL